MGPNDRSGELIY